MRVRFIVATRKALRRFVAVTLLAWSCLLVSGGGAARAHTLQVEPVAVELRPQENFINARFSGNVQDITQTMDVTDAEKNGDRFAPAVEKRLQDYLNQNFIVQQGGETLRARISDLRFQKEIDVTKSKFSFVARYPRKSGGKANAPLTITTRLFGYLPNATTLLTLGGLSRKMSPGQTATIDPSNLAVNLFTNVWGFFTLGIEHIFTGPDHMLFILALLLVSDNLKTLIKTLTGFTIAHSLTLVLSTLGVVSLNARWVDIFVALSIVYVGGENLFLKSTKHRFWIASAFGLVHGFAFAQNLRDAGLPEGTALFLSLLSFNVGVETAQVMICAAAFPLLMLFKKDVDRRAKQGSLAWPAVVKIASCGVVLAGGKWLFDRLLS